MPEQSEIDPSIVDDLEQLFSGSEFGDAGLAAAMRDRLAKKLSSAAASGQPLRVYAGYDPTAPDLHLGHSITLRKLAQFQRLGHHVTVVLGTATATVGDTSDRLSGRPRKSLEEVVAASQSYADQVYTILDPAKTEVVANSTWLNELNLPEILDVAAQFTVQQFLVRDNYRKRLDRGEPVGLHEFFYALLQGYDCMHLETDVQLGATEQLFNIMAGCKLQEAYGQDPCVVLTFPILVGTDGVDRMSKSRGNYIGLTEAPDDQFGKVMSVSDETMLQWVPLVSDWSVSEVGGFRAGVSSGAVHPMTAKKQLAHRIVALYHGAGAADGAQTHFENVHQRRDEPADIPEVTLAGPMSMIDALVAVGAADSKSAARRLLTGGGVSLDGTRVEAIDAAVSSPATLKVGSRRFYRLVFLK